MKKILIIGAGITGLTIAKELSDKYGESVMIIEKEPYIGGLAATLSKDGFTFDLGSHRLHPDYPPKIFSYLTETLGVELLKRPRNGALHTQGKFIRYPANIFNFIKVMSLKKSFSLFTSYVFNLFKSHPRNIKTYEEAMLKTVGKTIYLSLYKDFAKKLWGIEPSLIAVAGMKRRNVTINLKTIKKALLGQNTHFFYPKAGIGEIAQKLEQALIKNHVTIIKESQLTKISFNDKHEISKIHLKDATGKETEIDASIVVSTIPIDSLHKMIYENKPVEQLHWRGLLLIYLHIKEPLERKNDTFYFPELTTKLGRVSNNNKFSPYLNSSIEGVFLTIEIPSGPGEELWAMDENQLVEMCSQELVRIGLYKSPPCILNHFSIKLDKAYPLYSVGWEEKSDKIYDDLKKIKGLYTLGRRGLFLHSNIDHAILQGIEFSDIIIDGHQDSKLDERIKEYKKFTARD